MIKTNKLSCPKELTFEKQKELTNKYLNEKGSVWKQHYIENALLLSSHSKCIYCECKINVESKYMEVEHFHDKSRYPLEVVNWENLLPSCKRCNGNKSTFNTKLNPFINPSEMVPRDHLILYEGRFYPITEAGENTINEILLNDRGKLVQQRLDIVNAVLDSLNNIYQNVEKYHNNKQRTTQNKNTFMSALENLLEDAMPSASYSATVATAIINNPLFIYIVDILNLEDLWNEELQEKFNVISELAIDTSLKKTMAYRNRTAKFARLLTSR
ncbi:HNH endonuclease [Cytobacillus firmus]